MADELKVPRAFLREDANRKEGEIRESDYIPVDIKLPGMPRPLRVMMAPWAWVPPGDALYRSGPYESVAALWTNLQFWRAVLLDHYDASEESDGAEGAPLIFVEHMLRALQVALAPVDRGAKVHAGALGRLLNAFDPTVGARFGGAPPNPPQHEETT